MNQNNFHYSETSTNTPDYSAWGKQPEENKNSTGMRIIKYLLIFVLFSILMFFIFLHNLPETVTFIDNMKQTLNAEGQTHERGDIIQERRHTIEVASLRVKELNKIPLVPECDKKNTYRHGALRQKNMTVYYNKNVCNEKINQLVGINKPNLTGEEYLEAYCTKLMQLGYRYNDDFSKEQYDKQCLKLY